MTSHSYDKSSRGSAPPSGGDDITMMSYVEGVVLAGGQPLPAGGAAVRRGKRVSHTLAAEDVTAASGDHQAAALHDLHHRDTATNQEEPFRVTAHLRAVSSRGSHL